LIKRRFLATALVAAAPLAAAAAEPPPTVEQILSQRIQAAFEARLGAQESERLQCNAANSVLRDQLAQANAAIARLEKDLAAAQAAVPGYP
jgi:septal ring factor EnvC (AmiA/AmiB activator)